MHATSKTTLLHLPCPALATPSASDNLNESNLQRFPTLKAPPPHTHSRNIHFDQVKGVPPLLHVLAPSLGKRPVKQHLDVGFTARWGHQARWLDGRLRGNSHSSHEVGWEAATLGMRRLPYIFDFCGWRRDFPTNTPFLCLISCGDGNRSRSEKSLLPTRLESLEHLDTYGV